MRDLPKGLPSKVRGALDRAAQDVTDVSHRKAHALNAYERHRRYANTNLRTQELRDGEASSLFDWAVNLQEAIRFPFDGLVDIILDLPAIAVVSHEIVLPEVDGIPSGRLKTVLELDFDEERLLNHHDWFDGCRVTGGGTLNTRDAIYHSVHPEMLRQIHALVAEGEVWDRVIHGFDRLIEAYKDR
jgi:hypothetical protein